jgi:hypothetical protein
MPDLLHDLCNRIMIELWRDELVNGKTGLTVPELAKRRRINRTPAHIHHGIKELMKSDLLIKGKRQSRSGRKAHSGGNLAKSYVIDDRVVITSPGAASLVLEVLLSPHSRISREQLVCTILARSIRDPDTGELYTAEKIERKITLALGKYLKLDPDDQTIVTVMNRADSEKPYLQFIVNFKRKLVSSL